MTDSTSTYPDKKVAVLVADDSLVFRRLLRDIFDNTPNIEIVGEACNGIESLDLILKVNPDVILMDMEMPLMDGMTALQHLMIHRPTPTIMFSSISKQGTARAFDALKNGAVDFVSKDFIFLEQNLATYRKIVTNKVMDASRVRVFPIDPILLASKEAPRNFPVEKQVIFCEECGAKQVVENRFKRQKASITCENCGDLLTINIVGNKYRRNSFVSVIGGGEGCFRNLLNIVPKFDADMGGAIIVVVHAETRHVDAISEYLDAISGFKVMRIREGMHLEGGNCYIASAQDYICLRPYSAQYSLQRVKNADPNIGSVDLTMASVASIFKDRSAGVLLSGDTIDGIRGMATIRKNGGSTLLLKPEVCLSQRLPEAAVERLKSDMVADEMALVEQIQALHYKAKSTITTA